MNQANTSSSRMTKQTDMLSISNQRGAKQKLKAVEMKLKENKIERAELRKMLKTKQFKVNNVKTVFLSLYLYQIVFVIVCAEKEIEPGINYMNRI